MHEPRLHQGQSIWLIAGTGEGPVLAEALLLAGWRVRVSLVSPEAARTYQPHPRLDLEIGPLAGADAVARAIEAARRQGEPFRWVVDASHPFAQQVRVHLLEGCRRSSQPLLRLQRPDPSEPCEPTSSPRQALTHPETLLNLAALASAGLDGRRVLLAIGARRLAEAVAQSPGAVHHARVLPRPAALRQALASGVAAQRLAVLQPGLEGSAGNRFAIEQALCQQWRIEVVLCRRSGGLTEQGWRQVAAALDLRLLLLERPQECEGAEHLSAEALLARIGAAPAAASMEAVVSAIPGHASSTDPPGPPRQRQHRDDSQGGSQRAGPGPHHRG